jgi:hypothetical protein
VNRETMMLIRISTLSLLLWCAGCSDDRSRAERHVAERNAHLGCSDGSHVTLYWRAWTERDRDGITIIAKCVLPDSWLLMTPRYCVTAVQPRTNTAGCVNNASWIFEITITGALASSFFTSPADTTQPHETGARGSL